MKFNYSLTLNDAHWFLHQAKGLPDVPNTRILTARYLRATVVFSWIALEQMLDAAVDFYDERGQLTRSSVPRKLRDKLESVLAIKGRTLNRTDFTKYRKLRNDITHSDMTFSFSDVEGAYTFCSKTISAFYPEWVLVTHEDVTKHRRLRAEQIVGREPR